MASLDDARDHLRRHFGFPDFRPDQQRVVAAALAGHDVLAVLPTGAGKSACFQVPALALGGLTIVISPLLALMQDQVAGARRRGIAAAALTSQTGDAERRATLEALARGSLRLLYVAPEALPGLARRLPGLGAWPALLAVDEAHCISEWGHEFRSAYRRIGAFRALVRDPPCIALTGSATPLVRDDIVASLGLGRTRSCVRHVASFDRPNIAFRVVRVATLRERRETLFRLVRTAEDMVLVYVPTRALAEAVAARLRRWGLRAAPYHAGLTVERRRAVLEPFLRGELPVVAATCAFGMGIDQPRVRRVVHWAAPPTLESYYQEAGRAGRDGRPADAILLAGPEDFRWRELRLRARPAGPLRELALARLAAVSRYATAPACRRARLLAWFGERLASCSGCDWCDRKRDAPGPRVRALLGRIPAAIFGARRPSP